MSGWINIYIVKVRTGDEVPFFRNWLIKNFLTDDYHEWSNTIFGIQVQRCFINRNNMEENQTVLVGK